MGSPDIELTAAIKFDTDQASASAAKQAVETVTAGAKSAANEVSKIKPAAGADKEFQKVSGSAEKSFAAIDAARQVTEGGLMGVGATVKNLAGQFPALQAALGPIGLIIAAVAAWANVVKTLLKNHGDLEKTQKELAQGNYDAQIKRQAEAYNQLYIAMRRASEERQRFADIEQSKDDAAMRSALAKLELEKEQRYAMLSPDDAVGRRTIDLDISTKRSGLEEGSSARMAERDARTLQAKETEQRALLAAKKNEQSDLEAQMLRQQDQAGQSIKAGQQDSGRWFMTPLMKQNVWEGVAAQMEKIAAKSTELFSKIQEAQDAQYKAQQSIVEIKAMKEVNAVDRGTLGTKSQTRQTADYNTGTAIDRDQNVQLATLLDQLNERSAEMTALWRNYARVQLESQGATQETVKRLIAEAEASKSRARQPGG